jgi:apolipoprotein N-acyltransferase
LVLSNDANLPPRAVEAEIAQARLRAAETGRWVVRIANRGTSVAIDPVGRTAAEIRGGALRVEIGEPVPAAALSLGPAIEKGCGVVALCTLVLPAARRETRSRARQRHSRARQ